MSRRKNPYNARTRQHQAEQKRKKKDAAAIKKAQLKLRQALGHLVGIQGHYEVDQGKKGICEIHNNLNIITRWLDNTAKEPLEPFIDTVFDDEATEQSSPLLLPSSTI